MLARSALLELPRAITSRTRWPGASLPCKAAVTAPQVAYSGAVPDFATVCKPPDSAGFRAFSTRYRAKYGQEPVRTATLAYDAVALVAALVKQQPSPQRFSEQTLTSPSGFAGIDGVFRFRTDGTNERGLAVLRVAPSGGQVISPAPRAFSPGT